MFAEVQRKLIKEQWKDGFPINATLHLCTDGSKTEQGTEAGYLDKNWNQSKPIEETWSFPGKNSYYTRLCQRNTKSRNSASTHIASLTHNQCVIKGLDAIRTKSRLRTKRANRAQYGNPR